MQPKRVAGGTIGEYKASIPQVNRFVYALVLTQPKSPPFLSYGTGLTLPPARGVECSCREATLSKLDTLFEDLSGPPALVPCDLSCGGP